MFVGVSLDDSHEDPKVFFFFFNFGSMPFGVGENHEKVKEQISRFDQLIKREWKEKKIERERDDKTIICMLKNLPLFFLFFFFLFGTKN